LSPEMGASASFLDRAAELRGAAGWDFPESAAADPGRPDERQNPALSERVRPIPGLGRRCDPSVMIQ
jgi:hypothetical protein